MGRHFDVVGSDDDVDGADVLGADVLGDFSDSYEGGAQVVGYNDEGYPVVVGKGRRRRGPMVALSKAGWRNSQLAPGVIAPDQGLLPLPMGSFTYGVTQGQTFTFQGQLQKPFRGERLLVSVVRTGTTATGRIMGQIFVGSDLAALDVPQLDIQQIGDPTAFGVRLTMKPAQPGVFIRIVTSLSSALTTTDTIFATVTLLGRLIH